MIARSRSKMYNASHVLWKILVVAFGVLLVHLCVIYFTRGEDWLQPRMNLIIDTDAGGDDAVAVLLALATPGVRVVAVTCSYGNTDVTNVENNVLKILTVANRTDIPVYSGAKQPLNKNYTPTDYFGNDGFGDFDFGRPVKGSIDRSKHASLAMIELVKKYEGDVRILTLGPLTNVALAMSLDPSFGENVARFYMMGFKISEQESDEPAAEFNFGLDPASNEIFFNTPKKALPLLLPSDVVARANISKEWRERTLGAIPSPSMAFLNQVERVGIGREPIWKPADSMACAAMLLPELVSGKREARLEPIVGGPYDGSARVHWNATPNVEIVRRFNAAGFQRALLRMLA